jgi:large conductance mechanosensitive channel
MRGFRKFLMRGNLIDLAVAVVIGVVFNAVVQAMVADMVTPLIAAAGHKPNFNDMTIRVGHGVISYGAFLNTVISFLITAAVVYYLIVAPAARATAFAQRNKAATQRECPQCQSQIPVGARKCMYCTSEVEPVPQPSSNSSGPSPAKALLNKARDIL